MRGSAHVQRHSRRTRRSRARATIERWRGKGASDDELRAAGSRGVAAAIAEHEEDVDGPTFFELRVVQAVTSEILKVLPKPEPLGVPLVDGDFDEHVTERVKKVQRKLGPIRRRYRDEFGTSADGLSAFALATFDLYRERFDAIVKTLRELLERDATLLRSAGPEFCVHALELPADGERRWSIALAIDSSASVAHVELEGWMIQGIGWSH